MLGEVQNRKVGAALLWLSALALAGVGAVHALRSSGHGASEPVLHAVHSTAASPSVSLRQLGDGAMDDELQVAALQLALRWEEQGYTVEIVDGAQASRQASHQEVLLGTLGSPTAEDPEQEQRAWRSLGLRRRGTDWVTPDGRAWPQGSSVLSVTLAGRHLDGAVRRLGLLGLGLLGFGESVASDAALVTLLLKPADHSDPLGQVLKALSHARPPSSPGAVLYSRGQRVFEVEFNQDGFATDRVRTYARAPAASPTSTAYGKLAASASRSSAAIRSLGKRPQSTLALKVVELSDMAAYTRDGAQQRSGWYDASLHRLVVYPGLTASADDAVEDFLETELLRTFGRPASPWFLRGMIYVLTGRAGGFQLTDLESRSQAVTLDDVLAPTRQRTRLALAPVEARLARGVLAEFNSDVAAAWSTRFEDDEDMTERLRSQWEAGLVKAPVVPATGSPREWSGGVTVAIVSPARGYGQFGSAELHRDFERIAALGFSGVQLTVHVPVVPPTLVERSDLLFDLGGWGYGVTVEGDGAVLVSAAAARALGLSVVLEPRFVMSASGVLGHKQVFGSAERIQLYGDRRAPAMEGVAWLAEQAGAEALVMFDPEELPREVGDFRAAIRQQAEDARSSVRERSALYGMPFKGECVAFSRSLAGMALAAAASELTAGAPAATGEPNAGVLTSVGLELSLDTSEAAKARGRRVLLASGQAGGQLRALRVQGLDARSSLREEPTWSILSAVRAGTGTEVLPHAVVLGPWRWTSSAEEASSAGLPANLRELSDERLRLLATLPR